MAGACVRASQRPHGRLVLSTDEPLAPVWAANVWRDAERIPITSIGHAATELRPPAQLGGVRACPYRTSEADHREAPVGVGQGGADRRGRADAPLGSWTLLEPDLLLAASNCESPFPNGEARLVEDAWPAESRISSCTSRSCGSGVGRALARPVSTSVPARRLDVLLARPRRRSWRSTSTVGRSRRSFAQRAVAAGSAFALDPRSEPPVDWLCSDIICYPQRLLGLVQRWLDAGTVRNVICTIKFQGATIRGWCASSKPSRRGCAAPAPQPPRTDVHARPGCVRVWRGAPGAGVQVVVLSVS